MKSSGNSSAPSPTGRSANPAPASPSRKRFALTGRSQPFDPRTTAARADLADIRVADRVFAPHYAAPMPRRVVAAARLTPTCGGEATGSVAVGDMFEVLELTARHAWGVSPGGAVGYLPLAALAQA